MHRFSVPRNNPTLIASLSSNRLDVYVQYFKYSDPELVSLQPSGGSQTGGMPVRVRVRDFVGIESRVAAALPSFEDCIPPQQGPEISVLARVKCSGHNESQPVEGIEVKVSKWPGARSTTDVQAYHDYDMTFEVPESTCGGEQVLFEFEFVRDSAVYWHPSFINGPFFKYRDPGISSVIPPSGMINVGNDKVKLVVSLEDVDIKVSDRDNIRVMLDHHNCTLVDMTVQPKKAFLTVQAPQLPREDAGRMNMSVIVHDQRFETSWEYIKPPSPQVDMTSVLIDGADRYPFWMKFRSVNATGANTRMSFIIENLSLKFGFVFDQLQVWFDGSTSRITREQFQRGVRDTHLSFEVDGQGLTPGQYSLTIHVVYEVDFWRQ
jgi:hypothetical protein